MVSADDEQSGKERRSSPLPKICFTCFIVDKFYLVIADLNDGVSEERRLCKIGLRGFRCLNAFAIDSTVFLFDSIPCPGFESARSLYSYELPRVISEMADLELDKSALKEEALHISPKDSCSFLRYRSNILVFSSSINYCDKIDVFARQPALGFQLYDPVSGVKKSLPQLSIRLSMNPDCFQYRADDDYPYEFYELFDAKTTSFVQFEGYYSREHRVVIKGFSLFGGDTFLVQTNLGRAFKMDLQSSAPVWEVCEWETGLCLHDSRFFVIEDRFCVDADGAYTIRKVSGEEERFDLWEKHYAAYEGLTAERVQEYKRDYKNLERFFRVKVEAINRRIPLLPNLPPILTEMNLVESINGACIVQAKERARPNTYDEVDELVVPSVTVMLVEFDFTKFPELDWSSSETFYEQKRKLKKDHAKNGEWCWAKRLKSVEFTFDGKEALLHDVFPLQI